MPTTPRYGFPWPAGTDRVMDGDNAMGALAQAIEDALAARFGSFNATENRMTGSDLTLAVGYVDVPGCSISYTSTVPERAVIVASFDANITVAGASGFQGIILVDGATQQGSAFFSLGASGTGRAVIAIPSVTIPTLAPGAHTIKLQAHKNAAPATILLMQNLQSTKLVVLRVPALPPP